jgi:hypothetical protein
MKITIEIEESEGTTGLIVKNELKRWLKDNFIKGENAEVNIE